MTENNGIITESGRDRRGHFAVGNPGRSKGCVGKHVLTAGKVVVQQSDALVEKTLEMALDGNKSMLKLFVSRISPRDGLIQE